MSIIYPVRLSTNQYRTYEAIRCTSLYLNSQGNLYSFYSTRDYSPGGVENVGFSASSDSGVTWSNFDANIPNTNFQSGYYPWVMKTDNRCDIFIRSTYGHFRYYCTSWNKISIPPGIDGITDVCLDANNNIHALVYYGGINYRGGYMKYDGSSWSPVVYLNIVQSSGKIAIDYNGDLHIFASRGSMGGTVANTSYLNNIGGTWSAPYNVNFSWTASTEMAITPDNHVHCLISNYLTPAVGPPFNFRVMYRQRSSTGRWSSYYDLTDGVHGAGGAGVSIDSTGKVYLIWSEAGNGTYPARSQLFYQTVTYDYDDGISPFWTFDWGSKVQVTDNDVDVIPGGNFGALYPNNNIPTTGVAGLYITKPGTNDYNLYYWTSDDMAYAIPPSSPTCTPNIPINFYSRTII